MALRFIESFDAYGIVGTESDVLRTRVSGKWDVWAQYAQDSDLKLVDGVETGQALRLTNGISIIGKHFDNQGRWIVGFYLKVDSFYANNRQLLRFRDGTTTQCHITHTGSTSKTLELFADGVSQGETSALNVGQWYLIEVDITFKTDATGECNLWVDNSLQVNGSSVVTAGTANNYAQDIRFYSDQSTINLDDIYMADGTAGINAPVGYFQIKASYPTSDSTPSDWTVSTGGDHYALVSDTTRDTTDYVYTDVNAEEDMFNFTAPTEDTIHGIQLCVEAASSGSEIKEFKGIIRHDGNDSTTSANLMAGPNTPTTILTLSDYQVGTTTAWTGATIAAADFGCEKVS